MMNNIIETKSFAFAVRIVKLYKMLTNDRKEYVLSKQQPEIQQIHHYLVQILCMSESIQTFLFL